MKIILVLFLILVSCEKLQETPAAQPVEEPKVSVETQTVLSINVANAIVENAKGEKIKVVVEIAQAPEERRQGLQRRERLDEGYGMWFVFPTDVQDPFWMKDTPVSLDIIFVDVDRKIVDFFENAIPNSETLLTPRRPYRTVLEVHAGFIKKHGLQVGHTITLQLGS